MVSTASRPKQGSRKYCLSCSPYYCAAFTTKWKLGFFLNLPVGRIRLHGSPTRNSYSESQFFESSFYFDFRLTSSRVCGNGEGGARSIFTRKPRLPRRNAPQSQIFSSESRRNLIDFKIQDGCSAHQHQMKAEIILCISTAVVFVSH